MLKEDNMKEFLITGGAGFIGSSLAKRILKNDSGAKIWIIDNLSTGYRENIPEGCEFIEGDIDEDDVIAQLNNQKFDAIFHIAGQSSADVSYDDPIYDFRTNGESTLKLLQYCQKSKTSRILFASTMSVYGDVQCPVIEKTSLNPNSFYGVGKVASEHYLRLFAPLGIQATSLRLFNVYGPGQNMANLRQGMVSIFMHHILSKQELVVKGDKNRFRDFVYIDDVVSAFLMCLENPSSINKIYNVGTCTKTTVGELIENIFEASDISPEQAPVKYEGNTQGDQFGIYAQNQFIKDEIGWEPKTDLKTGLKLMAKYYQEFEEYQC